MGVDEVGTLAAMRAHRAELIDPKIAEHGGRIVKTMSDGLLLEFPSVVAATTCAIEAQTEMAARNDGVDEDKRITFRIGVHVGDIIVEGDDILGDGVNVAARIEALAEPGGVAISGRVHDDVRDRLEVGFVDMGQQSLKNIVHPVRIWLWSPQDARTAASTAASHKILANVAPPLSDKPSIAVLPFDNMSGDPEQEYFADGITEEILTALTRFSSLFVIARNSSFTYKGKAVDIKQVGQELGVRYVLEGSVRKAGARVRITCQLIEAALGGHVWADRYDGDLEDIFALQDVVSESVVGAIAPSVERAEIDRARRKPTDSLDAYDLYLRALPHFYAMSHPENQTAMALLRNAIARDRNFATAKYLLASCLTWGAAQGWFATDDVKGEALELAQDAVRLDSENAEVLAHLARQTAFLHGRHADAIDLAEQATARNVNSFMAWSMSGWVHGYAGESSTALTHFERAFQLSPRDPLEFDALSGMAIALLQLERDDEAIDAARRSTQRNPNFSTAWRVLAAALAQQGKTEQAMAAVRQLLQLEPALTVEAFKARPAYTTRAISRLIDGLRKAGLPE